MLRSLVSNLRPAIGYNLPRMLARFLALAAFFTAVLVGLHGCAGGGATLTGYLITPNPAVVVIGRTLQLTAIPVGTKIDQVAWSVVGGAANGTVSASGLYTAPGTPGTYTVKVASKSNSSVSGTIAVDVTPGVAVTVTGPMPMPRVLTNSSVNLTANVTGDANTAVTWQVLTPGGGSVSAAGVYTAPATAGSYAVQATSVADPTKSGSFLASVFGSASVRLKIEGKSDITMQLDPISAPLTSANLVTLINKGFYDGIIFHRYEVGFVIQGGDPLTKTLPLTDPSIGTGGPGYTIPFETNNLNHIKYALAMASTGAMVGGGSQFYITLAPQPSLDGSYCVFGFVTGGHAVVDSLRRGDKIVQAIVEP